MLKSASIQSNYNFIEAKNNSMIKIFNFVLNNITRVSLKKFVSTTWEWFEFTFEVKFWVESLVASKRVVYIPLVPAGDGWNSAILIVTPGAGIPT